MIARIKNPTKISIFLSGGALNAAQVREKTGADVVINGGLYDLKTMRPACHLRVNGVNYASDVYHYDGYGWDREKANISVVDSFNKDRVDNYICCSMMIEDSRPVSMVYDAATGGARGNTAIGRLRDGTIVVDVHADTKSERITPEALQKEMLSCGCIDAMRLDGGASSQFSAKTADIKTSRKVHNYICIWGDVSVSCPYAEPTANIRLMSLGDGAKWVQWHLNANGANLSVDGIFGPASVSALKKFQASRGLDADGVCGPMTREALKENASEQKESQNAPTAQETQQEASCPYKEPTSNLRKGSRGEGVKWLQWHLNRHGAKLDIDGDFGQNTHNNLVAFQVQKKLDADGICGPATRKALKAESNAASSVSDEYKNLLIKKREAMLDYIERRVGDIYVYGAQGEVAGDNIINWSARVYPQYTTPARVQKMKQYLASHKTNPQGEIVRAFDCSGLFWAAENIVELPLDKGKDIDDSTAATLYNTYCVPVKKEDLQPLDLVFNSNLTHVAIVGRFGKVIEAAGSDIGVVCAADVNTRVLASIYGGLYRKDAWTKFGRLKIFADAGI